MSFVERYIILCPYFEGSTIGGSTVQLTQLLAHQNINTLLVICNEHVQGIKLVHV